MPEPVAGVWSRWKRVVWVVCQVAATAGILSWIFSNRSWRGDMVRAIQQADPVWFVVGVCFAGVEIVACTARWRLFLAAQKLRLPMHRALRIYLIAIFFSLFLPGAVTADAVRGIYLVRERPDRKTATALSIVMDQVAGLFALIVTAAVFTAARSHLLLKTPLAVTGLCVLLVFLFFVGAALAAAFWFARSGRGVPLPGRWPGVRWVEQVATAMASFVEDYRRTLLAMAVSFVALWSWFATYYAAGRALHANCSLADIFTVMPIVDVATAVPLTVGGLGVREAMFQSLLHSLSGMPGGTAVLISLLGFACMGVWSLVGGAVFALYRTRARKAAEPDEGDV